MQSKGTVISVHKAREVIPGTWGYQITEIDEKKVSIKVCTSASAIVGKYQLFVDTVHKLKDGASQKCRYCHPDDIFVIFNPWCVGKENVKKVLPPCLAFCNLDMFVDAEK